MQERAGLNPFRCASRGCCSPKGNGMSLGNARKRYIPMSETMFYILLSLKQERYGYGILQHVKILTKGRITLGAGTAYSSLGKLESDGLIQSIREEQRRKI
jgi:DNA-binding PadR family transcriptional regulator